MNLYRPKVKSRLAPFLNVRRETDSKGYRLKDYPRADAALMLNQGFLRGRRSETRTKPVAATTISRRKIIR